jgi:hypothetical protein
MLIRESAGSEKLCEIVATGCSAAIFVKQTANGGYCRHGSKQQTELPLALLLPLRSRTASPQTVLGLN